MSSRHRTIGLFKPKTVTKKNHLVVESKASLARSLSLSVLHTKLILQAGGANGGGLVLRSLQVCASIPGQQGGACAQHGHLGWRSGWLAPHLGGRRLGGLAENLLKTVGRQKTRTESELDPRPVSTQRPSVLSPHRPPPPLPVLPFSF